MWTLMIFLAAAAVAIGLISLVALAIVIIDGAYSRKMPSHYSTDKTQEIVETFPDPDKKIIYKRTWSTSQRQQRSKGLKYLQEGDWLYIVDDDEIMKEADLIQLRHFLLD